MIYILFFFPKICLFCYFLFQCRDLSKEIATIEEEIELIEKNVRVNGHEMDATVIQLDIKRKEKKIDFLKADIAYHRYRENLFKEQSKTIVNL